MLKPVTSLENDPQQAMASSLRFLPLVKNEIILSVESLAKNLETYLASRSQQNALTQFFVELERIEGCFFVLEMSGLQLFTQKLTQLAHHCLDFADEKSSVSSPSEYHLNTLTNGFFLIHRYLEFLSFRWQDTPELLIPEINRICRILRQPAYPISYFSDIQSDQTHTLNTQDILKTFLGIAHQKLPLASSSLSFGLALKRFRLMYQIGLLSILSHQDWSSGLVLLNQALKHLKAYATSTRLLPVWALSELLVSVLLHRVRSSETSGIIEGICSLVVAALCDIEKVIRQWQVKGDDFAQAAPDAELVKDLLYWLSLEESPSASIKQVLSTYHVVGSSAIDDDASPSRLTHQELWRAYTLFHGPSLQTRRSVVALLNNDIAQINDTLNVAIKHDSEEYSALLIRQLRTVSETLKLLELNSPAKNLMDLYLTLEHSQKQNESPSKMLLESIAEALILTDNTVQEFGEVMNESSQSGSGVQLQTAEKSLLDEVSCALQMSKRQLQLFGESGCQFSELGGIESRFEELLGGLKILNLPRAELIIRGCNAFISQLLVGSDQLSASQDKALTLALLDTFADVIVSLEFYFHGLSLNRKIDDRILGVAEQGLQALGIDISPV